MKEPKIINFIDEKTNKYKEILEEFSDWNDYEDVELSSIDSFLICMILLECLGYIINKYNQNTASLEDVENCFKNIESIYYSGYYSFYDSFVTRKSSVAKFSRFDFLNIMYYSEYDNTCVKAIIESCCLSFDKFNFDLNEKLLPVSIYMSIHVSYLSSKLNELYFERSTEHLKHKLDDKKVRLKKKIKKEYSLDMNNLIRYRNNRLKYEGLVEKFNIWKDLSDVSFFVKSLKDVLNSKIDNIITALSEKEELNYFCDSLFTPYEIIENYNSEKLNSNLNI